MGIIDWFGELFRSPGGIGAESGINMDMVSDDSTNLNADDDCHAFPDINPASGLPMLDNTGIDVAGNPFGTDQTWTAFDDN